MTMNRPARGTGRKNGFTLVEVMLALGVFAIAVVGLITALNTAMQAAIEVRERSLLRAELESQIALRLGIPLDKDTLVIEAKDNRGIRVEETLAPYPLKNKDDEEIENIKKLTITATLNQQSDSASILVNQ